MIKKTIFIISIITLAIWQISFLSQFSIVNLQLNIILLFVVFITVMINYKNGLLSAIISGLILDIYSPFTFGLYTIALVMPVLLINTLFVKLLARKTVYSIVLTMVISILIYHSITITMSNLFYFIGWDQLRIVMTTDNLVITAGQAIMHAVFIFLIFLFARFLNERIRSKFLFNERV